MQNKKVGVSAIATTKQEVAVVKIYTSSKFKRVKQGFRVFLKRFALCRQNIANTVNRNPFVEEQVGKEHWNAVKNQNAVKSGGVDAESIQERRQQRSVAQINEIIPQKSARYNVPAKERRILIEIADAAHHRVIRRSKHSDSARLHDTGELHSEKRSHGGVSTSL